MLQSKEDRIAKNRTKWTQVQRLAGPYLAEQAEREELQLRIRNNPDAASPDSPVAEAAVRTQVRFKTGLSADEETGALNRFLQVTGELIMRPLAQRRRRGAEGPQVYRVEKQFQMRRGFARSEDMFDFLGEVESLDGLVFVSKLHIARWSRDADYLQIKNLTASTLRYVDEEEN
jgi:hypothetical protein